MHKFLPFSLLAVFAFLWAPFAGAGVPGDVNAFISKHCAECHDKDTQKGDLDLNALGFDLSDQRVFARWVLVHDRVEKGEMPPKKKAGPAGGELAGFTASLSNALTAADDARAAREGRATQRRLNRYEYENVLRDLFHAPWLQIRDSLPEDGEADRFNKIGDALAVSHVQMARYLSVADGALRAVAATYGNRIPTSTVRYYTRDQRSFTGKMTFNVFNTRPERATFPVVGWEAQPDVRSGKAPMSNPNTREEEAVGVVASTYEPIEITFNRFKAPASGHYHLRFKTYTVWAGPGKDKRWYIPDFDHISKGRRSEPVTIYSETPPRLLRRLGSFDAQPDPSVAELDVQLLAGETIWPDAARLFRSRPPSWVNPLAEKDGSPGVAFAWMEVEGPLYDKGADEAKELLFGDLPLKSVESAPRGPAAIPQAVSKDARRDAEKLLRDFIAHAYREPFGQEEIGRFMKVFDAAMASQNDFTEALLATYTAVLCSPRFICLEEKPGVLDDYALASRLSFFLWNSGPDDTLRQLAASGELHRPEVLKAQTDRLLNSPKSRRFVDAFLDYWLDLRKIDATAPDTSLYNDYYLDDLLTESALAESQLFFGELIKENLPASNLVSSDFTILNERLANHYGIKGVDGVTMRRVKLPADSVRGGFMTQASVLKVTANGTTTSPVVRGAWIMERMLGKPPPPKPKSVPAVEPDIRGATTIRQQLEKHRTEATCSACHAKIDPAGFALENFDVLGGWRDRYRALGKGQPVDGIGKDGQHFAFHLGPAVDASGELPDGGKFHDIRELKGLLLQDRRQIGRNLVQQLLIYGTGAPVRFGDRAEVEQILDRAAGDAAAKNPDPARQGPFGVRSLIEEIVQSRIFKMK